MKYLIWVRRIYLVCIIDVLLVSGLHAEGLVMPIEVPGFNVGGIAVGTYPDWIGSADYSVGAIPFLRYDMGNHRHVQLTANELTINMVDDSHWRAGPVGLLRFGRDEVEDPVVSKMSKLDHTLELGGFVAYEWVGANDPRERMTITLHAQTDVLDAHGGQVAGISARGLTPVVGPVTLGYGVAATWADGDYHNDYFGVSPTDSIATGLPEYSVGSGWRDVRGYLVAIVSLSRQWHVGGGVFFSHLLDGAADSPLVTQRGDTDQLVYGVGALYAW